MMAVARAEELIELAPMASPPLTPPPPSPPPSGNHHQQPPADDSIALDVTLACVVLCVGVVVHHLHGRLFHRRKVCGKGQSALRLSSVITDTSALLLLGVVVNAIASAAIGHPLSVARSPQVHDLIDTLLVPPIMLEVGFNIAKLSFLRSLPHALLFGIGGTALSVALAAAGIAAFVSEYTLSQALIFAAICASTEPSPILELLPRSASPQLQRLRHVLVGEAALNGSLAIALFAVFRRACRRDAEAEGHAVVERLDHALAAIARDVLVTLPASVGIGLAAGLLTSLLTLRLAMAKTRSPYGPVTLVLAVSFATYNLAERGGFNGDLALFTTGCTLRHYAYHNLAKGARQAAHDLVGTLAYLGDTALALLMGLAVVDYVHKPCDDSRKGKEVAKHRETAARLVTSALAVILMTNLLLPPLVALLLACVGKPSRRARTAAAAAAAATSTHGGGGAVQGTVRLLVNDHLRGAGAIDDLPPPVEDDDDDDQGVVASINGRASVVETPGGRRVRARTKKGAGASLVRFIGMVERRMMQPAFGGAGREIRAEAAEASESDEEE